MSQQEFWKQFIYHCRTWKVIEMGLRHIEKAPTVNETVKGS